MLEKIMGINPEKSLLTDQVAENTSTADLDGSDQRVEGISRPVGQATEKSPWDRTSKLAYVLKHLRLFYRFAVISWKRSTEYKFNFFLNNTQQIVTLFIYIYFWRIILNHIPQLQEWDFPTLTILTGFVFFNQSLMVVFWAMWTINRRIVKGDLDVFLVRPVSVLFAIIGQNLLIYRLFEASLGLAMIGVVLIRYHITVTLFRMVLALLIVFLGAYLIMMVTIFLQSLSFWLGRTNAFTELLQAGFLINRYPITIFPKFVIAFFTVFLPVIFIATYPTLVLVEFPVIRGFEVLGGELLIASLWTYLVYQVWRRGIRRYENVGG
jgi:ABC-2 type transport system permease protein